MSVDLYKPRNYNQRGLRYNNYFIAAIVPTSAPTSVLPKTTTASPPGSTVNITKQMPLSTVASTVVTTTPKPYFVTIDNVKCSVCDDITTGNCSMVSTRCGANEVCQIQQKELIGPATTKCINVMLWATYRYFL